MADNERPFTPEGIDVWIDQIASSTPTPPASAQEAPEQRLLADLHAVHQAERPMEQSLARVWERLAQSATPADQQPREGLSSIAGGKPPAETLRGQEGAGRQRHDLDYLRLMPPYRGGTFVRPKQIGSVAAIVTLAAVVALIVVLLHNAAPNRSTARSGSSGTPQPNPSATATTVPTPSGQWVAVPGLANTTAQIMIAPSNPNVIYEDQTPAGGASKLTLRRSDDGGATWHPLAQPAGLPTPFDESAILVSPLDANTIFETLTVYAIPHPGICQASGTSNALFSGGPSCSVQFYSSDGGQHWSRLSLPVPGGLGAPFVSSLTFPTSAEALRPQGQRLYSAISNYSTVINTSFGGPGVRIIASDDGGKTWQLADGTLGTSGQNICDFTPTSTGTTIFAITQTSQCYTDQHTATALWRSDDGGAHWTQIGPLPGPAASMLLVSRGASADPLIYVATPAYPQQGVVDPRVAVSQDGGKTWLAAPAAGIPDNPPSDQGLGTKGPLAVLSDGSVVKVFPTQDNTVLFLAWKIGEKAWHAVAPVLQGTHYLDTCFTTPGGNGKATFWTIAEEGTGSTVFRYDQQ